MPDTAARAAELAEAGALPPTEAIIVRSQSGGRHVVYRCQEAVSGNLRLAQRCENGRVVTFIETRGEGGLFLCAPSMGYEPVQGHLVEPPTLTAEERESLLLAAWELNAYWPTSPQSAPCGDASPPPDNHRPGDDFNARGDVVALLEKHGWQPTGVRSDGNQHWTRPGKLRGTSATLKDRTFYVFSSNAHPFEPNGAYSPFAVYAMLEHGGDYESAARELRRDGYGYSPSADSDVDLSSIVDAQPENNEDAEPAAIDPGPIPEYLFDVPGFVRQVMDFTLSKAPYPNAGLAFCGAMALQSFLAGRKVRTPGEPITQPGDLWVLGNHRLLCGDSSSVDDVDRLLDGAAIHLANTDPPYNVRVEPRSNNAIAAGLSSFEAWHAKHAPNSDSFKRMHHQGLDLARHPEKSKPTTRKMRAKDRPLENDFVSDEEFDRLLDAWFGNIAAYGLPTNWRFWERHDRQQLAHCDALVVLTLDGWRESEGVQAEIRIAGELGKPVRYLAPDGYHTAPTFGRVATETEVRP